MTAKVRRQRLRTKTEAQRLLRRTFGYTSGRNGVRLRRHRTVVTEAEVSPMPEMLAPWFLETVRHAMPSPRVLRVPFSRPAGGKRRSSCGRRPRRCDAVACAIVPLPPLPHLSHRGCCASFRPKAPPSRAVSVLIYLFGQVVPNHAASDLRPKLPLQGLGKARQYLLELIQAGANGLSLLGV